MAAPRFVSDATYDELFRKLKNEESHAAFREMSLPAKVYTGRHEQQLVIDVVFDALDGREERVCYMPTCDCTKKVILLRHSEVNRVINLYYERWKGGGARKLYKTIT